MGGVKLLWEKAQWFGRDSGFTLFPIIRLSLSFRAPLIPAQAGRRGRSRVCGVSLVHYTTSRPSGFCFAAPE